ncbi:hypothetical protein ABTX81_19740 [Kitasatospora sp. NPDC097605]|uniref:hypothetical protein n=1 Tax=Kitasatospora sp. NPDC097605 TaxID=3157226 RepID=UPI0033249B7F
MTAPAPTGAPVETPAAAHRAMADHLPAPLRAAVYDEPVPLTAADGRVTGRLPGNPGAPGTQGSAPVAAPGRPLVLAGPGRDLAERGLRLTATVAGTARPPLLLPPFTEADALHPLPLGADWPPGAPFELAAAWLDGDGTAHPLNAAEAAGLLRVRHLSGTTARLLYVLGAPKAEIRRIARQIAASRTLAGARSGALDALGAELGAPRFAERLTVRPDGADVEPARESDEEYRARLAVLRPWAVPSPQGLAGLLNGAAPDGGALARFGISPPFTVEDSANGLAMAFRVVAPGGEADRLAVLDQVRAVHLVQPGPDGDAVHAARPQSADRRARDEQLRAALRAGWTFADRAAPRPALARGLAAALVRLAACRRALGRAAPGTVLRVQDPAGGSRYELGVGADLTPLTAADLAALAARVRTPGPVPDPSVDPETRALIAELRPPADPADDPDGRWLLVPCGLATVHRLAEDRLFVSHLPLHGLAVDLDADLLRARYAARQDERTHAVLGDGLAAALRAWAADGAGTTVLADRAAAVQRLRAEAQQLGAADPAVAAFRAAGLPAVANPLPAVEQLPALSADLYTVITLPGQLGTDVLAGRAEAVGRLRRLVGLLRDQWLVSALPVVLAPAGGTGTRTLALVLGAVPLPQVGTNLNRRRAVGFRWQTVPLRGSLTLSATTGPGTTVRTADGGVGVVVTLGYARRRRTDPYEFSVDLPGGTLGHREYEALMNLLDRVHPAGIAVDTSPIRRGRVVLGGGPDPTPLSPEQSRLYRDYRPGRGRLADRVFKPITAGLQVGVRATVRVDTYLKPRQGEKP